MSETSPSCGANRTRPAKHDREPISPTSRGRRAVNSENRVASILRFASEREGGRERIIMRLGAKSQNDEKPYRPRYIPHCARNATNTLESDRSNLSHASIFQGALPKSSHKSVRTVRGKRGQMQTIIPIVGEVDLERRADLLHDVYKSIRTRESER